MNVRKYALSVALVLGAAVFASKAASPGFSIKSDKKIWIAVLNVKSAKPAVVEPWSMFSKKTSDMDIDINGSTSLAIYLKDPRKVHYAEHSGTFYPMPRPDFWYSFAQGKTVYVSFDGKALKPQSGTFGKTTKGYPLANNVSLSDIRPIQVNQLYNLLEPELRKREQIRIEAMANKLKEAMQGYRKDQEVPSAPTRSAPAIPTEY